jgi:hypothetical protein
MGIGGIMNVIINYNPQQSFKAVATDFAIGALEGAVGYGIGSSLINITARLIRFVKLEKIGGLITRVFRQMYDVKNPIPGTSFYEQFVFRTQTTEVLISSGRAGGTVTGALKHIIQDILRKGGGGAAQTKLAEALALRELEGAIDLAVIQGINSGQPILVKTAYAEWELIFEYTSSGMLKLSHALPRIL